MERYGGILVPWLMTLSLGLCAQDTNWVRNQALDEFGAYVPEIEASQDLKVQYRKAFVGHLNKDQELDAAIEFGLGQEKSNKAVERQIAVYINRGDELEVVAGLEPDYCPDLIRIRDRKLIVMNIGSCIQPSSREKLSYSWNGDELVLED